MKSALLCTFLLLAGCSVRPSFQPGQTLVSATDGSVLGKVIEIADHSFPNGASGPSVHIALPSGRDAWYSLDTTREEYLVQKR